LSHGAAVRRRAAAEPLSREETILKYMPLVRAIAGRVREGLPVHVELDDLVHAGALGLFDAIDKFNPAKNVGFHLYAKHRIRGAILDSLRQLDWASRDLRKRYKSIDSAVREQAQKLGRTPTDSEVAGQLGLTEVEFRRQKWDLNSVGLTPGQSHRVEQTEHPASLETAPSREKRPDEIFANQELREALGRALATLPERYRTVIKLYYLKECTMKEIGAELGVNESRISQIHKSALQKLGAALESTGHGSVRVFLGDMAPVC
jgi:RNA polymerase sigma factor FliA